MITVGLDFGTHQTKVCYEKIEQGTTFFDVVRFKTPIGKDELTLPSFIRRRNDGTLRYGHDAVADVAGGQAVTYFKQKMFSMAATADEQDAAKKWAILYLAFVIFLLDKRFHGPHYVVQMGMPTSADPLRYNFCKRQALTAMASAMHLSREVFHGDLDKFLQMPYAQLSELVKECGTTLPQDIAELRKMFPILVFPEAYAALIPLINDHKLPKIGPSLFVDIGGGTVDISLFTNQMDVTLGKDRPCLYHYHSEPYGLNMITGQNLNQSHIVKIDPCQITKERAKLFLQNLKSAVDEMMAILQTAWKECGKDALMPFRNLCGQMLDDRPICYSGGGSMFHKLRWTLMRKKGFFYRFTDSKSVSELIDHAKLLVKDRTFPVLATAFALSHHTLAHFGGKEEPDSIALVPIEKLYKGVKLPAMP